MTGSGKVALVTGGAVRVGRAIVEELARAGWRVAYTYRTSAGEARNLQAALASAGHETEAVQADVDDSAQRAALASRVKERFGALDALVNSAAAFPRTPIDTLDSGTFSAVLRTNLEAPVLLTLACAPLLRERRGAVVNIVDIYGITPLRGHLAYSVSKAALIAATRSLAVELAPEIRVNAVAPGIALFPPDYDPATREKLVGRTLLKREGGADEIARAVRYLVEGTDFMTGQVLTLDGGRTLNL